MILAVFVIEMAVRVRARGLRFLWSGWGAVDCVVIGLSLLPALGLDSSLLRLCRTARLAHLLRHVPGLRVLRLVLPNASAVTLAAAATVTLMVAVMGATPARADDDDSSTEQEICGSLHLGLEPDDIAERLGRNDPRYNNYWQAWRAVGPTIVGGDCA